MKYKYINATELIEMFRDDEMLSCDRPFDIYQWALNIIDECPAAENVIHLPIRIGAEIRTADGRRGVVDTYYIGKKGVQRIFAVLEDRERINFTPKGIGRDVFLSYAENSRSERSDASEDDYASEDAND